MPSDNNDFDSYISAIRTAVYGKDVRAAIANGLVAAYNHGGSGGGGGGSSQDLTEIETAIAELESTVSGHTTSLSTLSQTVDGHTQTLSGYSDLSSAVATNTQDISELRQLIEDYHYTPITVSSLSISPTYADIKSTVTEVKATYKLSKDAVTMTIAGQSITDPAKLLGGTTQTVTLTGSWTKSSQATQAFKIIVTDERGTSANKSVNLTFANRAYYGAVAIPETLNEEFIKTQLGNGVITTTCARSIEVTAGADQYIYYAYPKRFGLASFTVGGFSGGFSGPTEVSVTSSYNYT